MKTINELFRLVILANELENNERAALRFSDPDGVLSGKSGWSFGVAQFDTRNNCEALKCLADCGFTQDEIHGIVDQTINVIPLAARLLAHADVVARYDEEQLSRCITSALNVTTAHGIFTDSATGILSLADYINQYGSIGPQFIKFMKELGKPVTATDVLDFKLQHTKYGREHPKDCKRRFNNLMEIVNRGV